MAMRLVVLCVVLVVSFSISVAKDIEVEITGADDASLDVELADDEVYIPGGWIDVGVKARDEWFAEDSESPIRRTLVEPFVMDQYEVSNARIAKWIEETEHETDAEKFGWSFVHQAAVSAEVDAASTMAVTAVPWWIRVDGATWRHPEGPDSDVLADGRENHPAVHISWQDAKAFCEWEGKRLPTEAEWEAAARGGKTGRLFPWGNKVRPRDTFRMNICQGTRCPVNNTLGDGHLFTAPIDALGPQNAYGLYNMVGNVWEWVQDVWCDPAFPARECHGRDPSAQTDGDREHVKKGGSFLCHKSFCYRYRVGARSQNSADSSSYNLGARCARDL